MGSSKSETISQEISGLQARRQELATELSAAIADLAIKREGLVEGTSSVGEVTAAQATYSALSEALKVLDGRIESTGERLKAAQDEETAAGRASRLREIEQERQAAASEFVAAMQEANAALSTPVARMLEQMGVWARLGWEARKLVEAGTRPTSTLVTTETFPWPKTPLDFGDVVVQAYQAAGNREERRRLDERRAQRAESHPGSTGPAGDAHTDAAASLASLRN